MICFPNAKINLGLQVIEKRADNFHNIASVIVPVAWFDVLEFQKSDTYSLTVYGLNDKWEVEENLVTKAWHLLKNRFDIPPLEIHLYKSIPIGSGLGGGSSDAAFLIKKVNEEFKLEMSTAEMKIIASKLGSDCPFFIENKTILATGKGDVFEPIELYLDNYFLLLVKPELSVSTADAYQHIHPKKPLTKMLNIIQQPIHFWKDKLENDFEKIVFEPYPELALIKDQLYQNGAIYASMSGSGSAIYGIFEKEFIPTQFFKKFETRGGFLFKNKIF